jgi:hypothetical protein
MDCILDGENCKMKPSPKVSQRLVMLQKFSHSCFSKEKHSLGKAIQVHYILDVILSSSEQKSKKGKQ